MLDFLKVSAMPFSFSASASLMMSFESVFTAESTIDYTNFISFFQRAAVESSGVSDTTNSEGEFEPSTKIDSSTFTKPGMSAEIVCIPFGRATFRAPLPDETVTAAPSMRTVAVDRLAG